MDSGSVNLVFRGGFWAGQHAKLKLDELSKWCQIEEGSELEGVLSSGVRRKKRRQCEADKEEWPVSSQENQESAGPWRPQEGTISRKNTVS